MAGLLIYINSTTGSLDFVQYFPKLSKYEGQIQCRGGRIESLSTDGVAASIVLSFPQAYNTSRHEVKKVFMPKRGKSFVVESVDGKSPMPPVRPRDCQHVIGIDPGKRDMAFAVNINTGEKHVLHTREHFHKSGRYKVKRRVEKKLQAIFVSEDENLLDYLIRLPSSKVPHADEYNLYVQACAAVERVWLGIHALRSVRRCAFDVYLRRDKDLNLFRQKLVKGSERPALIAFGAANISIEGMGFGYVPGPQKRLRPRLSLVHGARVTLIDEFNTSKKCMRCHTDLQSVFVTKHKYLDENNRWVRGRGPGEGLRLVDTRETLHAVKRCGSSACKVHGSSNNNGMAFRYVNRDENAAYNIAHVYLHIAEAIA